MWPGELTANLSLLGTFFFYLSFVGTTVIYLKCKNQHKEQFYYTFIIILSNKEWSKNEKKTL